MDLKATFFSIISFYIGISRGIGMTVIDSDADRTTCEIVIAKGYPCEIHHVLTADGYILELHRIPRGKNEVASTNNSTKKVIFLQHGLEDSSATWVINMESQSLGFIAADASLDVWMGNVRGNVYCRRHMTIPPTNHKFWNFTFSEIAKYDLPAMINFVLNYTQQPNLYYVGHSQGTVTAFVLFSEDPIWAVNRIKQFHALSPCAWLGHSTTSIRLAAPLVSMTSKLFPSAGLSKFNADNYFGAALGALSCNFLSCTNYAAFMSDSDITHYNKSRNSVYSAKVPSGTSTLNIWHYIQLLQSGRFETYGPNPVLYHPNTSIVPTYLYWSNKDVFSQPEDFAMLKKSLYTIISEYQNNTYDHLDFVWSLKAAVDIYPKILNATLSD